MFYALCSYIFCFTGPAREQRGTRREGELHNLFPIMTSSSSSFIGAGNFFHWFLFLFYQNNVFSLMWTTFGASAVVFQGEPQSMAMIYQLVTQACEQLVHSKQPVSKLVKKECDFYNEICILNSLFLSKCPGANSHSFLCFIERCVCVFFRGGVEARHVHQWDKPKASPYWGASGAPWGTRDTRSQGPTRHQGQRWACRSKRETWQAWLPWRAGWDSMQMCWNAKFLWVKLKFHVFW